MNKSKLYMIVCIMILIVSISGSFAWYTWESTYDASIALGFCIPEISFIGGTTLNGENLVPVTDKNKGLKKQIDVYLNKTCKEGDSGVMNLYMKLDVLPDALKDETFIFEVVKDDEVLFSGNFKDKSQGQTIELLTNQIVTENDSIYFIYIYIDGTRDNPIEMSNQNFRFTVWGEGTGAIYKNNVIANPSTPTDSSSTFLNTSIVRSSIQTLTIAENNEVPEESQDTAVDISSKGDGSVMLWYTYNEETEKYDIYMGSENGVIETNTNGQGMFAYLENVETLDLTNLDTSNITNMSSMFQGSSSLTSIKLSNFDTSNVTSMRNMFYGCTSLTSIDVSSFDTSNVTNMVDMFCNCSSLVTLDLSNFDTSNVTSMNSTAAAGGLFRNCSSLVSLNVSSFDTSKVTSFYNMFNGCSSLITLDISNFNTSSVTNMGCMFQGCSSFTTLDLSNFDTSSVTNMYRMFYQCQSLISLDVSNFNTANVTDMNSMFRNCSNLTSLNVSNFDTLNVTTMSLMFQSCSNLTTLDVSNFNTTNVTNTSYMFVGCSGLTELDLSNWNTSNVTNMRQMFDGCTNLITIYVSNLWNTSGVTSSSNMFIKCKSLVGSSGTTYNSSYVDVTYARVDEGTDSPGYLTLKS